MTGQPAYNFPAFDYAKSLWMDAGWHVESPADITRKVWREWSGAEFDPKHDTCDWGDPVVTEMFKRDLAAVCDCDAIALLPGWQGSKGAAIELALARQLGKQVLDAHTFMPVDHTTETALQEAQRLVHGARGDAYGHPAEDYARTGRIWGAILGIGDIDPRIACLMMAGVKISREVNQHKRDNLVDLAGYAECAHMVAEYQAARRKEVDDG